MTAVEQTGVSVIITGAGEMEEEIRRWCAGDAARRAFLGLLPREKLHDLMREAFACVNPHQGDVFRGTLWPFKVAEYLAYNGNVLSTDLPADEEVLARLELVPADSVMELAKGIQRVMQPGALRASAERRTWAQDRWGVSGLGRRFEPFFGAEAYVVI
jgi:hypothetical protein